MNDPFTFTAVIFLICGLIIGYCMHPHSAPETTSTVTEPPSGEINVSNMSDLELQIFHEKIMKEKSRRHAVALKERERAIQ